MDSPHNSPNEVPLQHTLNISFPRNRNRNHQDHGKRYRPLNRFRCPRGISIRRDIQRTVNRAVVSCEMEEKSYVCHTSRLTMHAGAAPFLLKLLSA